METPDNEQNQSNNNEDLEKENQGDQTNKDPQPTKDNFDVSQLRLPQNFADSINAKKVTLTIPVCKPHSHWFIRVHNDEKFQFKAYILEIRGENKESYLVTKPLWKDLLDQDELTPVILFVGINRDGMYFVWPIRLTNVDNSWNQSSFEAVKKAMTDWVRVKSNKLTSSYAVVTVKESANISEPDWSEFKDIEEVLKIAFKGKIIDFMDHPILRRLRGEI